MLRCDRSVGRYEVILEHLNKPYGGSKVEEMVADIGDHQEVYAIIDGQKVLVEDAPRVSQYNPYIGELCEHEVDWLSYVPGTTYSRYRRYTVRRLDQTETKL